MVVVGMAGVLRRWRLWIIRDARRLAWAVFISIFILAFMDSSGFIVKIYLEKDYSEFSFPLEAPNFPELVHKFGRGEELLEPINLNYSRIPFIQSEETHFPKCHQNGENGEKLGLLIMVKSAPNNFEKRAVIRGTWGDPAYLQNITSALSHSSPLLTTCFPNLKKFRIRLVFLLGMTVEEGGLDDPLLPPIRDQVSSPLSQREYYNTLNQMKDSESNGKSSGQKLEAESIRASVKGLTVNEEILRYNDIVRADFTDSYENNTLKAILGLRWALEFCPHFHFALLADDDMHISVKNLLKFIESPKSYPQNVDDDNEVDERRSFHEDKKRRLKCETPNNLYAGKVLITRPVRFKLGSKWYVSLDEYPFNLYPPYTPAAAVVLSRKVVEDFYHASLFTKHFRFDDVFLGILAKKLDLTPINSDYFHVCHSFDGQCHNNIQLQETSTTSPPRSLGKGGNNFVIARHGMTTSEELIAFWKLQKEMGNLDF